MYASVNTLTAAPLDATLEKQAILEKLFGAQAISRAKSQALFSAIVHGELEPAQLAAALISMKVRGEHPEEIAGAAAALTGGCVAFPTP